MITCVACKAPREVARLVLVEGKYVDEDQDHVDVVAPRTVKPCSCGNGTYTEA